MFWSRQSAPTAQACSIFDSRSGSEVDREPPKLGGRTARSYAVPEAETLVYFCGLRSGRSPRAIRSDRPRSRDPGAPPKRAGVSDFAYDPARFRQAAFFGELDRPGR